MGLGNSAGGGKFITIVNGKWTLRVPEGTDGASERKLTKGPNTGTAVWEKYYDHVEGEIVGGEIKAGQYGTDICITLRDGDDYIVQIPMDSGYFSNFSKALPNVDPTKNLFLGLGHDRERNRDFLYVKQDGATVHAAFTKDNPGDCPAPVKKTVRGVEKWDFEAQEEFLYGVVVDFFDGLTGAEKTLEDAGFVADEDEVPF